LLFNSPLQIEIQAQKLLAPKTNPNSPYYTTLNPYSNTKSINPQIHIQPKIMWGSLGEVPLYIDGDVEPIVGAIEEDKRGWELVVGFFGSSPWRRSRPERGPMLHWTHAQRNCMWRFCSDIQGLQLGLGLGNDRRGKVTKFCMVGGDGMRREVRQRDAGFGPLLLEFVELICDIVVGVYTMNLWNMNNVSSILYEKVICRQFQTNSSGYKSLENGIIIKLMANHHLIEKCKRQGWKL